MSSKTKIVVLHMKELIYTIVFLALALLLGVLIFLMFQAKNQDSQTTNAGSGTYQPGIYRSTISLGENTFDVEVTVDSDEIQSINLTNLNESTTAAFPLMEPSLDALAQQIYASQSLENITYSEENKYTSMMLLDAIAAALEKARPAD